MDKQEYKICLEEIMSLIANEQFREAADIADRIDWRKVRSFSTLMQISDLYKLNRRTEDALELMLLAYDKNPKSRSIVYGLCELYTELNDKAKAIEFLAIYRKMAPNDPEVYILQYKILEMIEAPFEERIALLEDLCRKDYREEWAYQLAYLYHRIGFGTKCVEACNELIAWFGDGPFVIKAMELKMLHARLTPEQQAVYNARDDYQDEIAQYESDEYTTESPEPGLNPEIGDMDFHVKTIDMSKFNTINLQKALAESMRELMDDEAEDNDSRITRHIMKPMMDDYDEGDAEDGAGYNGGYEDDAYYPEDEEGYEDGEYTAEGDGYYAGDGEGYEDGEGYDDGYYPEDGEPAYEEEAEEADFAGEEDYGIEEGYDEEAFYEGGDDADFESEELAEEPEDLPYPEVDETEYPDNTTFIDSNKISKASVYKDEVRGAAAAAAETAEEEPRLESMDEIRPETAAAAVNEADEVFFEDKTADIVIDSPPSNTNPEYESMHDLAMEVQRDQEEEKLMKEAEAQKELEKRTVRRPAENLDNMLRYDDAGQIELAVESGRAVEKQITGQIHMDEYISGWEEKKKRRAEEIKQETERKIKESTGPIFKGYDEKKKNSLIHEIEEEQKLFSQMYEADDIEFKNADEFGGNRSSEFVSKPVVEKIKSKTGVIFNQKHGSIWDEVDASIRADQEREAGTYEEEAYEEEPAADAAGVFVDVATEAAAGLVDTAALPTIPDVPSAGSAVFEEADTEEPAAEETEESYNEEWSGEEYGDAGEDENGSYEDGDYPEDEQYGDEQYEDEQYEDEQYEDEQYGDDYEEYPEDGEYAGDDYEGEEYPEDEQYDEYPEDENAYEDHPEDGEYEEEYGGEYENDLSVDEQKLFENFLYSRKMRDQILDTIDQISLNSFTGNVILSGDSASTNVDMAKALVKEMQMIDNNFVSSRVAKISATKLNNKDVSSVMGQLAYGALLIEKAGELKKSTLESIASVLDSFPDGIIVIMMDNRKNIERMLDTYEPILDYFNTRIDIVPMNNNALVEYAKKYAYSREYKIDEERGVLALHQRISELQIGEHNVTTAEIEDIIEAAIEHSSKPHLSTVLSIIGGKRYDYEDMIILREKDFQ